MKELDRFTSERLESLCDYRPNRVTNLINFREIAALARIALAAKRAEPAMFRFKYPGERDYTYITHRKPDAFEMEKCEIELLYTTPQLNSPEIPDGWPTEDMVIAGFESGAWDALSSAVLKRQGWPYSCRESAECVTGIFKAMLAAAPEKENG